MKKIKTSLIVLLSLVLVLVACGCAVEPTPYETNNEENYTVSVKFDANGGSFTTNDTPVIIDSYNLEEINKDGASKVEIPLISPDNASRKNDKFEVSKSGSFLAGWYSERIETVDENGNTTYTYSGKWDFDNDVLTVDATKEYKSEEPVLTLYAAWIPLFEIEFYSRETGATIDEIKFNPITKNEFSLPDWDEETGCMEMYDFPEMSGYTFSKAYLDAEGSTALKGETLSHPGVIDYATGTAEDTVLKLYVDYTEGEWYRIYNAEQFKDNAKLSGCYELMADLDFADEIWPTTLMYGNFTGIIKGNGHTIKNVSIEQTNNSKVNAGLFGAVADTAEISDLTFSNVDFTVKKGTRVAGTSYGLFAGTISQMATLSKVNITDSRLLIDSGCHFGTEDYSIGLVCGMGDASVIKDAEISCSAVGDSPEKLTISISGNDVTIEFKDN